MPAHIARITEEAIVKRAFVLISSISFFATGTVAIGADEAAERAELKKKVFVPECSWSNMSKDEYEDCQKKRDAMEAMTPRERAKYLEANRSGSIVVNDEPGGAVRNVIRNRSAHGGKGKR